MGSVRPIQITVPADFLTRLDVVVADLGTTRSALIREVMDPVLREHRIRMLERLEAEAYAKNPQTEQELADLDGWRDIEAWGDDEAR
jgi:metal-responsive CopG/Arc/MetJ family transcriptional regulator